MFFARQIPRRGYIIVERQYQEFSRRNQKVDKRPNLVCAAKPEDQK